MVKTAGQSDGLREVREERRVFLRQASIAAMQGLLAQGGEEWDEKTLAERAVWYAEALQKQLDIEQYRAAGNATKRRQTDANSV